MVKNAQMTPGVYSRRFTAVEPAANATLATVTSWSYSGALAQVETDGTPAGNLVVEYRASPDAAWLSYGSVLAIASANQAVSLTLGTHPELALAYELRFTISDAIADGNVDLSLVLKS